MPGCERSLPTRYGVGVLQSTDGVEGADGYRAAGPLAVLASAFDQSRCSHVFTFVALIPERSAVYSVAMTTDGKDMAAKYRIVEHHSPGGERLRAVHEVSYDNAGRLSDFVGIPVEIVWDECDGDETGLRLLEQLREAFAFPVLQASDFARKRRNK
ncbi:hypothetical protein PQR21_27730 [Paraburkholderia nemoris]|uniref:hypothetical protein n=1 Tax=Paraburkholderia nemoris TaxID=2793076 RepID=UPI0038B875B6